MPFATNRDVRLVGAPGRAGASRRSAPAHFILRQVPGDPSEGRTVGQGDSALRHHGHEVAIAQPVADVPANAHRRWIGSRAIGLAIRSPCFRARIIPQRPQMHRNPPGPAVPRFARRQSQSRARLRTRIATTARLTARMPPDLVDQFGVRPMAIVLQLLPRQRWPRRRLRCASASPRVGRGDWSCCVCGRNYVKRVSRRARVPPATANPSSGCDVRTAPTAGCLNCVCNAGGRPRAD